MPPSDERVGEARQFSLGAWRGHTLRIYVLKDCSKLY